MSSFVSRIATVSLAVLLLGATAAAAETPRKHNPWAMFSPGAWRQARVVVQVFDKDGKVVDTGITERKEILEEVSDHGVTLRIEESVCVSGKWLDRQPETIKQGLYGESEGQDATIKDLDPETIVIEGRKIPCNVREVQLADSQSKRLQVSRIWFSNDVAPFVFRRTTTIKDPEQKTVLSETTVTVNALRMPCLFDDEVLSVSHLHAMTEHAKGKRVTLTDTSTKVPGGVVRECTKETDTENRLVRRRFVELIDWDREPPPNRRQRRQLLRQLRRAERTEAVEAVKASETGEAGR